MRDITDPAVIRLMILYFLQRQPSGAAHEDLLRLNMEQGLTSYFDMEQQVLDLCEIGLIRRFRYAEREYLSVSAEGLEVVEIHRRKIPLSVRTAIDDFILGVPAGSNAENEISADYEQYSEADYAIRLRMSEGYAPIMEIRIRAADEDSARGICARFREEASGIYADAIKKLTTEEKSQ